MMQRRSEIFGHLANRPPHRRQLLPGLGGVLGPVLTPLIGGGGQTVTQTQIQTAPAPAPTVGYPPQPPNEGPSQSGGGVPYGGTDQSQPPGSNGEPPPSGGQPSNGQPGPQSVSPSGMAPGGVTSSAIGGSTASPFASGIATNGDPANSADPLALPTAGNESNPISSAGSHSGTSSSDSGKHGSGGGSSNGAGGPAGQAGGPQGTNGASVRHGLTSGAIAGIVLSILLASMVVLFVLWRRAKSRRASRKWQFIQSGFEKPIEGLCTENSPDIRVPSTRNSLGTDFDPALTLNLDRIGLFDDSARISRVFDPLAVSATPGRPSPISVPPLARLPWEASHRNSAGSFKSDEGQTLSIFQGPVDGYLGSDHASIPFSPPGSFASFEHPPSDSNPDVLQRVLSPESNLFSNQSSPTTKQSSLSAFVPASPGGSFAELQVVLKEKNHRDTGLQVGDVEIIQRLFRPSSNDELLVAPGDVVRIVKPFDNGWALVEQMNGDREGYQGHVPTDCLSRATRRPCSLLQRESAATPTWLNRPLNFGMAMKS